MDINKIKKISSGLLLLSAASLPLSSAYATANLTVTAAVVGSCTTATSPVSFGDYDPTNGKTATGTITMTCTNGTLYNIGLGAGNGAGASDSNRKMTKVGGTETLPYSLYSDSGRTLNWGSILTDSDAGGKIGTGTGTAQDITVYGSIEAGQTSPVGTYSDTVAVIVVLGN